MFKQWGEWKPYSQMTEDETNALYRSRRRAEEGQDQGELDEVYGRTCTVPTAVVHMDGRRFEHGDPEAFWVDGPVGPGGRRAPMSVYRVGKHAAGRLLDGVLHDGFPDASRVIRSDP